MRVAFAISAATALLTPTAGCTGPCNPSPPGRFALDEEVSEESVLRMVEFRRLEDRSELTCEHVCTWAANPNPGTIDACEFEIYPAPDASRGGEAEAGWVVCSGTEAPNVCEGRRPLGHRDAAAPTPGDLVGHLALAAQLEAASVVAFEELAVQLAGWGAPPDLVARCRAAANDERAHARATLRLATRRGARVRRAERTRVDATPLAVALHNAVEGCVGETWAAFLADWRARRAPDAEVRALSAGLAADELRHAEHAWEVHDWLVARLPPAARRDVARARRRALRAFPRRAAALAAASPAALGDPSPAVAARLAAVFSAALRRGAS